MLLILLKRCLLLLITLVALGLVVIWRRFLRIYMVLNKLKLFINVPKLIHLLFALVLIARLISDWIHSLIISRVALNYLAFLLPCQIAPLFCIFITRRWYCLVLLIPVLVLFLHFIVCSWIVLSLLWRFWVLLLKTFRVMIGPIAKTTHFLFSLLRII